MATTIQIAVFGALLLAWVWALSRPMAAQSRADSDYCHLDSAVADSAGVGDDSGDRRQLGLGLVAMLRRRFGCSGLAWRRQLMLATMFAAFFSFFLAIALRGRFVTLFLVMLVLLVVHLAVAVYVGSRMLAVERARAVQLAKKRVRPPAGISIRAERAGFLPLEGSLEAGSKSLRELEREQAAAASAFDVAAELAAMLDKVAPTPETTVESLKEELDSVAAASEAVESEVAVSGATTSGALESEVAESEVAESAVAESKPVAPETPPPPPPPDDAETTTATTATDDEREPIFRQAAKDKRRRSRRQAKPIYIESQLDDGETLPARAVNDQ